MVVYINPSANVMLKFILLLAFSQILSTANRRVSFPRFELWRGKRTWWIHIEIDGRHIKNTVGGPFKNYIVT